MPIHYQQSPTGSPRREIHRWRMFCELSPAALSDFELVGLQMRIPKGAVLFQEGDRASNIAVICDGQMKVQSTSPGGKPRILRIAVPGCMLGVGAAISGGAYEATVQALQRTIVRSIRKDEFLTFLEQHAHAKIHAAKVLSEEYESAFFDARHLALASSAAGRVASVLLDLGRSISGNGEQRFTMALTHEELGSLAFTSRETVTRILSRFRRENWIRVHGSTVTILTPDRLKQLAY